MKKAQEENATLKRSLERKRTIFEKYFMNMIKLPLKNTSEFSFGPSL
jgi:hypothetical protein